MNLVKMASKLKTKKAQYAVFLCVFCDFFENKTVCTKAVTLAKITAAVF